MNKTFIILLSFVMSLTLVLSACQQSQTPNTESSKQTSSTVTSSTTVTSCTTEPSSTPQEKDPFASLKLEEFMKKILGDLELPDTELRTLDQSNFEAYAFVPWQEGLEAVNSESLITTIPHSLVLTRASSADTEVLAKSIAKNANPSKWICVFAETSKVLYSDDYVLLVMSFDKEAQAIISQFKNLFGSENVHSLDIANPDA